MSKYIERKKALEAAQQQKIEQLQQLETARNNLTTEIVRIAGKLDLLKELELESSTENKKEEKVEDSE